MPLVYGDIEQLPNWDSLKAQNSAKKEDMPYRFFIGDYGLPWTPSSITISNEDRTEVVYLADDRPFTIPHYDGPQTFSFDFTITLEPESISWILPDSVLTFKEWTDYLWTIKQNKEPIRLKLIRTGDLPDMDEPVILKEYSYVEDAEKNNDFTFSVSFINWHGQQNQEIDALEEHGLILTQNARGWNAR